MKAIKALVIFVFSMVLGVSTAWAGQTELTWYGHSAFKITIPSGKILLIDPWITNPANKNGKADLAGLTHVDLILISHGHFDHVGDAVAIAKKPVHIWSARLIWATRWLPMADSPKRRQVWTPRVILAANSPCSEAT